jgi:hypothetical protein
MRKPFLFLVSCLAISTAITAIGVSTGNAQMTPPSSPGFPGTPRPTNPMKTPAAKPASVALVTFSCQNRGAVLKVVLNSDRTYKSGANPSSAISGIYQKLGDAYRFKDGSLKKQSIVQLRNSYYLVATEKEARAASIAATDAAMVCTRQR